MPWPHTQDASGRPARQKSTTAVLPTHMQSPAPSPLPAPGVCYSLIQYTSHTHTSRQSLIRRRVSNMASSPSFRRKAGTVAKAAFLSLAAMAADQLLNQSVSQSQKPPGALQICMLPSNTASAGPRTVLPPMARWHVAATCMHGHVHETQLFHRCLFYVAFI